MIRYLLWDNDGVLVDSEHLYFEANRRTLADCGVELSAEEFAELSLRRGVGVFELAPDHDPDELRVVRDGHYLAILEAAPDLVLPGVRAVLAELVAGPRPMAIVTSCHKDHFAAIHRRSGLLEHFRFVLANGDYPRTKPAPDGYLAAIARFGARPEECLVIEDTPRGLAAATAAGCPCVVTPSPFSRDADWSGAAAVIESIAELPELLEDSQALRRA